MRIVPAVDIRGGLCVNLVQGDYDRETVFSTDPLAQAIIWHIQGGELIHIVDLDGAKAGRCCIEEHLNGLRRANVPIEVGGGIRDMGTLSTVAGTGADRMILGTAAHSDPEFLSDAVSEYGDRIVVGIDARAGKVSLRGWLEDTDTDAIAFAKRVEDAGVGRIIYTDILSDGMMAGANLEATEKLAEAVSVPITASGGMSSLEDVSNVKSLESAGVDEVIIGRALYLKIFTLGEAIGVAGGA